MHRVDTPPTSIRANETLSIEVAVNLNGLSSDDVYMECLLGKIDLSGKFECTDIYKLEVNGQNDLGEQLFRIRLNSPLAGQQTYMIRLYPYHELLARRFETGYLLWL